MLVMGCPLQVLSVKVSQLQMQLEELTLEEEISLTTWYNSCRDLGIPSVQQLNTRLFAVSKRSIALLTLTTKSLTMSLEE